jgi:translocation and assembly module TamB
MSVVTFFLLMTTRPLGGLSALSLLENLSISAGKQLGPRTFLRVNTGVCRGGTTSTRASLWAGVAAEYRFGRNLTGEIGVDPGASPCTMTKA